MVLNCIIGVLFFRLRGSWRFMNGTAACDPRENHCYFKPDLEHNDQVTTSGKLTTSAAACNSNEKIFFLSL